MQQLVDKDKRIEYNRKYYQEHKEEHRQYYLEHRDKKKEYDIKYHREHRDEIAKHRKKRYEENKYKVLEQMKKWYEANKDKVLEYQRIKKYGVSHDDYVKMCQKQNYLCLICGNKPKILHCDHDHKSKKIRGLLCQNCNRGLGMFHDDVSVLENAISYLNNHIIK